MGMFSNSKQALTGAIKTCDMHSCKNVATKKVVENFKEKWYCRRCYEIWKRVMLGGS